MHPVLGVSNPVTSIKDQKFPIPDKVGKILGPRTGVGSEIGPGNPDSVLGLCLFFPHPLKLQSPLVATVAKPVSFKAQSSFVFVLFLFHLFVFFCLVEMLDDDFSNLCVIFGLIGRSIKQWAYN